LPPPAPGSRHAGDHFGPKPSGLCLPVGTTGPTAILTDWQTADVAGDGDKPSVLQGTRNVEALLADDARWYRAPELDTAAQPDYVRADVFSLGAITYALLAGGFPANGPASLRGRLNSEGGLRLAGSQAGVPAALADLVYQATRADAAQRIPDVDTFAALLHAATEAVPAAVPDRSRSSTPSVPPELPALAPGDIVAGRWRVIRELGSGFTARALLVQGISAGSTRHVLKVARDPDDDIRVREEAAILAGLDHPSIVRLVDGPITVGERAALVTEQAGETTLSALIRRGPLSPDLLETLGDNLLDAAPYLAARGVYHRDIKPANAGMRRSPERSRAVLFDFSHANVPLDGIEAGTVGHQDPFLSRAPLPGLPHRPVWDPAAELYAVAATLFEMAARTCPRYGDGMSDPQAVPDEATIGEDMFAGMPRWQQKELTEFSGVRCAGTRETTFPASPRCAPHGQRSSTEKTRNPDQPPAAVRARQQRHAGHACRHLRPCREATSSQSGIATICDVVVWLVGLGAVICLWRPSSTAFSLGLRENRRLPPGGPHGPYGPW
jgi:serine/threonine protein kinase